MISAAAVAAVLVGAALVQPSGATATPSAPGRPGPAPDPGRARYPIDCGPWKAHVVEKGAADFDGDGGWETVAVVRCLTGTGTPPSGVFVLTHQGGGDEPPRIAEVLVDPAAGMSIDRFTVRGRTISLKLLGYSSDDVPRCCPDQARDVRWEWEEGRFRLLASPAPGSV